MLLKEIAWRLKLNDSDIAKHLCISKSLLRNTDKSKRGTPSKYLFRLKHIFGNALDLNDIFSNTELYKNCHIEDFENVIDKIRHLSNLNK